MAIGPGNQCRMNRIKAMGYYYYKHVSLSTSSSVYEKCVYILQTLLTS